MENMDKGFTVPKWSGADSFAENAPKFICPSPKVWNFNEKRLHWASVVRVCSLINIFDWLHFTSSNVKGLKCRILSHWIKDFGKFVKR